MNEQTKIQNIVGFLEGMYYVGKRPSLAEVPDITRYLQRKGMIAGTTTALEMLVHTQIDALHVTWGADNKEARKHVVTGKSVDKADELNRMIFSKAVNVTHKGREVLRVLALEGDMIRLFFEMDATDPEKYTDVPYNAYLRKTR